MREASRDMRLFHFSDDPAIALFKPRPVRVSSTRAPGREWLNGPLVWAIDERRQAMYLFPRECPRILLWTLPSTCEEDREQYWGASDALMIAYVETAWLDRVKSAQLHRYELSPDSFEDLGDAGMWVSRTAVPPKTVTVVRDLPRELEMQGVALRPVESLVPLKNVWSTSLHASGIRLRNAKGWETGSL
jgi:hypothetical protein